MFGILSLFLLPLAGSLILFALPLSSRILQWVSFVFSLIPLGMLIFHHIHWIGADVNYAWFPPINIYFHLSIDKVSLLFLFLVALVIPISLLWTFDEDLPTPRVILGLVLLLESLMFGFFMSRDLVFFVIFWEAMLLPLYFLITAWGGGHRAQAALTFLIYMIAGSFLMIAGVLSLYFISGSFDLDILEKSAFDSPYLPWIFATFLLAFAVKTPLFPFHGWLPDTYYHAPTLATILLSALLSKAGIYGLFRIGWGVFSGVLGEWGEGLLFLAALGVLYGGLAAWRQNDYKKLIAYSSLSHVNFVVAGLFVWNGFAIEGALLQAFNHGITITALFIVAGWLEERLRTTEISSFGGLMASMPTLGWLTLFFVLSSVALPGLNSFIGEFLILLGIFEKNYWMASLLGLSVILSVVYMLGWMQRMFFGPKSHLEYPVQDIKGKELWIAVPLIVLIFSIGLFPGPILNLLHMQLGGKI